MRVLNEQCKTCVFRPGNVMNLSKDRLAGMVREAQGNDSYIVCHATLYGARTDVEPPDEDEDEGYGPPSIDVSRDQAVCRGYFDRYGGGQLGRIAERLDLIEYVDCPPNLLHDDQRIEHDNG